MLWDRGTWTPIRGKDPRKTIEEGHLHFTLDGERMKGEWMHVPPEAARPARSARTGCCARSNDDQAGRARR